jgi:pimeloyl-ACP methyl ester carboxylesterase
MTVEFEPITGRYMHLDLFGRKHRIYVEEAGQGTPLLVPAHRRRRRPAIPRADERCARHVAAPRHRLRHALARQVVAAVGLAQRGISAHLGAIHHMILEVMAALELDRPILIGCSIGGRIALHLALEHPEAFPRHHRPAGRRACRSLLRPEFPAPSRCPWRRSLRRHRFRIGRTRRAR